VGSAAAVAAPPSFRGPALFGFLRWTPPGPRARAELRCRVLEVMAASVRREVPLAPVVAAAAGEHSGFAHRALSELRHLLDSGAGLGASMDSCELLAFPSHTVAAVQAAEGTPRLAGVLAAAAFDDAAVDTRRAAVWANLFHPLLVLAFVGGVAGGIVGPTRQRLLEVIDCTEVPATVTESMQSAGRLGAVGGWIAIIAAEIVVAVWLVRRLPWLSYGLAGAFRFLWQEFPLVRGAARLGAAARLLAALAVTSRSGLPLHDGLRQAASSAGCTAVTNAAIRAARCAEDGAPIDEVADALLLPPSIRARFALAAARSPAAFSDTLSTLASDCAARYQAAIEARMRLVQPALTLFAAALVFTQFAAIFEMLQAARSCVPLW
jgi:type II secretory pathway component PulF